MKPDACVPATLLGTEEKEGPLIAFWRRRNEAWIHLATFFCNQSGCGQISSRKQPCSTLLWNGYACAMSPAIRDRRRDKHQNRNVRC